MCADYDLKSTLHIVVNHAIKRMESVSDVDTRRCIFQEYREWLGNSIDDWILALPSNLDKPDDNYF
tara:strand:- start:616 stop:813 length:198 start_codon:yes stop_codon:yes gene_type:complete